MSQGGPGDSHGNPASIKTGQSKSLFQGPARSQTKTDSKPDAILF